MNSSIILVKCNSCGEASFLEDFGPSMAKKNSPKWFQISHEYIPRKCPACKKNGKFKINSYGAWIISVSMMVIGSSLPFILEGYQYSYILVPVGLIILWLKRNDILFFCTYNN